jgi:hypothetical protein
MNAPPTTSDARAIPGMISLVLGTIAFLLFLLPVLGIPISAFGVFFGLVATLLGVFTDRANLRWSLLGLAVSLLALFMILAISLAPGDAWLPGYH